MDSSEWEVWCLEVKQKSDCLRRWVDHSQSRWGDDVFLTDVDLAYVLSHLREAAASMAAASLRLKS